MFAADFISTVSSSSSRNFVQLGVVPPAIDFTLSRLSMSLQGRTHLGMTPIPPDCCWLSMLLALHGFT